MVFKKKLLVLNCCNSVLLPSANFNMAAKTSTESGWLTLKLGLAAKSNVKSVFWILYRKTVYLYLVFYIAVL